MSSTNLFRRCLSFFLCLQRAQAPPDGRGSRHHRAVGLNQHCDGVGGPDLNERGRVSYHDIATFSINHPGGILG